MTGYCPVCESEQCELEEEREALKRARHATPVSYAAVRAKTDYVARCETVVRRLAIKHGQAA